MIVFCVLEFKLLRLIYFIESILGKVGGVFSLFKIKIKVFL